MRTPAEPNATMETLIESIRRILHNDGDLDQAECGRIVIAVDGFPEGLILYPGPEEL